MSAFYDLASLVVVPSGYKASKVYAQKPLTTDGQLAFTRSTTATRVGPDGLIEKVRTNLFTYSEQFNNTAAWQYQGSPIISANASVAPNGTTTADLLYPSVNGSVVAAIQSLTSASSVEYTQSVYVKASGKNFVALYTFNGTTGTAMWVNLTTGAITNGVGPNVTNRFATNVGNGWWRIGFTDIGNGTTTYMHVYPTDAASSNDVTASGTDGILLWGAQLETGVLTDYIATTSAAVSVGPVANVPRLDYLNSSCPRLLLEPQRTNSAQYSEQIDNASWTKSNTTITANAVTSPSGYQDADKLIANTTNASHLIQQNFTPSSATSYTLSTYAKAGEYNFIGLQIAFGGINSYASFNLSTGVIFQSGGGATATIQNAGNGWYRCLITATTISAAASVFNVRIENDGSLNNFVGNNVNGIYTWGCQLEAGAYATSYIPTLGAAVTRGADACSKTGISSLIGQTEGTLFAEFTRLNVGNAVVLFQSNDGTVNNRAQLEIGTSGIATGVVISGGAPSCVITGATLALGQTHKIALTYKANDFKFYVNGVLAGTDTSGAVPVSMSRIDLASELGTSYGGVSVSQILNFPTALSSAQLAELTA